MRAVLLAVLLVGPSAIAAPAKKPVPKPAAGDAPDTAPPPTATHNEGEYSGVKPGVPPKPDKKAKRPTKGTLSWIGFEAKNGGAEIFLQSIAAFEVAQHIENGVLVVDLGGLHQLGQNTWREVDARFFDTPIARIVARHVGAARASKRGPAHGAGVEVRISFKTKDAHEGALRTATEADGMYYAYLSFSGTGGTSTPTVQEPEK